MTKSDSTLTTAEGQLIHYVDHGGVGPAVVLLHGFLMDHTMFDAQVASLGNAFRFIAIDQRGQGGTPEHGPYTYWDVADDVLAVLDHLGIDRAALVGVSSGGFAGMRLALLAPERLTALVVLGVSADAEEPQVAVGFRQLRLAWVTPGMTDQAIDGFASVVFGRTFDAASIRAHWRTLPPEQWEHAFNAIVDRDNIADRLHEITTPMLVLHGSEDGAQSVRHGERVAELVANAEPFAPVQGAPHYLSFTDPDRVESQLRRFLTKYA